MEVLATVMFWQLVVTAVLATALAALIFLHHAGRGVRRLRGGVRSRRATQEEATFEHRARDAA